MVSRIWSGLAPKMWKCYRRTDIASTRPVGFASGKKMGQWYFCQFIYRACHYIQSHISMYTSVSAHRPAEYFTNLSTLNLMLSKVQYFKLADQNLGVFLPSTPMWKDGVLKESAWNRGHSLARSGEERRLSATALSRAAARWLEGRKEKGAGPDRVAALPLFSGKVTRNR